MPTAPFMRTRLAIACAAGLGMLGLFGGADASLSEPAGPRYGVHAEARRDGDYRYRIVGKMRLLLFWVTADDVGGARVTSTRGDGWRSLSLLAGTDPAHAPRQVNEWGYLREEATGDVTTVFGIRTLTDGASPDEAEARRSRAGAQADMGVLCETVSQLDASSRTTTVRVDREVTYRNVPRVLDSAERAARWNGRRVTRSAGIAPGFLTAADVMLRSCAASARESVAATCPTVAYVYKGEVYDLIPRRVERVQRLRIRTRQFLDLLRTEIVLRHRASGWTDKLSVTYGTDGDLLGVPIQATYQPSWWFKVELNLDEDIDVPRDPADDSSARRRMSALCTQPDR